MILLGNRVIGEQETMSPRERDTEPDTAECDDCCEDFPKDELIATYRAEVGIVLLCAECKKLRDEAKNN